MADLVIKFDKPSEVEIGVEFSAAWATLQHAWREGQKLGYAVAALSFEDLFEFQNESDRLSIFATRFGERSIETDNLAQVFVSALSTALREAAIAAKRCLAGAFLGEASRIKQMEFKTGDEFVDVIEAGHSCWPDELDSWPDSVRRPELGEVREFLNQIIALESVSDGWPLLVSRVHQIQVNTDRDGEAFEITNFCPDSVASLPKKKRSRDRKRHTRDQIATLRLCRGGEADTRSIIVKYTVAFNATPWPEEPGDSVESRVHDLIQIAARVIQDLRKIATNPIGGYFLPFEHYDWKAITTDSEIRDALSASQSGLIQCSMGDEQWILMELEGEVMGRLIPSPTPLNNSDEEQRGTAAEIAVRQSARWGLLDFIYRSHKYRKNNTTMRELNDAALISGEHGLAIQVKSKRPEFESDSEASRTSALIAQAASQAAGSVRELRENVRELTNDRGRTIAIDGSRINWIGVVIIDHSDPPEIDNFVQEVRGLPIVTLFREEWEFLFEQLCSTSLVVHYLHAVSSSGIPPGNHVAYYYHQAERTRLRPEAADNFRAITELDPVWLPLEPASTIDMRGARMFRQMLEDIACGDSPICNNEEDRLAILSQLDSLPAQERSQTGRFLINLLEESQLNETSFHCRRYLLPGGGIQLCFVISRASTAHDMFNIRARLWHFDWIKEHARSNHSEPYTIALLLTPRKHTYRPWATLMLGIKGTMDYSDDEIAELHQKWNEGLSGI